AILNDDVATGPVLALISAAPGFGNQVLGTTSQWREVTIRNIGDADVVLPTPFGDPPAGSDFAAQAGQNGCTAGKVLPPTGVCNLNYTFKPSALGPRTSNVVLSSNAPDLTLVLSGTGIAAPSRSSVQPIPTLSPALLALLIAAMGVLGWVKLRRAVRR
ncbi:MAG: hypothetical protein ABI440_12515, partial [Casimicrobiaceae bacterium]